MAFMFTQNLLLQTIMIRYYGLYAKHHKHESMLSLAVSKQKRHLLASALDVEVVSFVVIWL